MAASRAFAVLLWCALAGAQQPRRVEVPPDLQEIQRAQAEYAKRLSPELAAYQRRLRDIGLEIQEVRERFVRGRLDREEAKRLLVPLVKEQQRIQQDPEFLAEQQLAQGFFASPAFRARVEAARKKAQGPADAPRIRRRPTP